MRGKISAHGLRSAYAHGAFAEFKVNHFVDVAPFLQNCIEPDNAYIGGAVFDICWNIACLDKYKFQLMLLVGKYQLARFGEHFSAVVAQLHKNFYGELREPPLCEGYRKISHCPSSSST